MFGQEPDLEFVGANDVADQHVVGAVVAGFAGLLGHGASFFEQEFVSVEEPRNLYGNLFAAARRAGNDGSLGDVGGHGQADAAERLEAFGDGVDQFVLLFIMLIEKKMNLIEGVSS